MILYSVHLKVLDVGEKCIRVYDSLEKFRHDIANKLRQECSDMNFYMFRYYINNCYYIVVNGWKKSIAHVSVLL